MQAWEHYFKPPVRSSGMVLFRQKKISFSQPSDTEIVVFISASSGFKVIFKTKSVESTQLLVNCNCPAGKKGLFCKHIWAGLLAIQEKSPDFFESKSEIENKPPLTSSVSESKSPNRAADREASMAAMKEKQSAYRKQEYQKQKERAKAKKSSKKERATSHKSQFPADVQSALNYFSTNGFELADSLNKESVTAAKKSLARIFHPDLGGSHDEILELNKFCDILNEYILS